MSLRPKDEIEPDSEHLHGTLRRYLDYKNVFIPGQLQLKESLVLVSSQMELSRRSQHLLLELIYTGSSNTL